ncbi:MAG: S41 family peptidase [Sphingomonadaceae bacterium]|nr:S41 family peptidase [Sphingomonadaceae bacterium]
MAIQFLRAALLVSAVALVPAATAGIASADDTVSRDIERFVSVYERVKADYVDKLDDERLIKGAIDGMLASLDPHSSYLDARDFKQMQISTDGNYGGLGLVVSMEDGAVKVVAPQEDSPASKMGIKPGDYITHLDGKLIYGGTLDEAVEQMRGVPGTSIRLTVVRTGRDKPFDVTVTRQIIELKPVKWEIRNGVGIININGFSKQTGAMTKAAVVSIEKALGRKPFGYVIDLRSNPGGLLDQAVEVSDVFLDRVEVVSQRGRDKRDIERYFAQPGDFANGLPIVVLVDSGSASAAEIVAGALQDHHRGLVLGERTFGKGSVQTLIPLDETTALRLTTARYYTPSGRSVQEGGIEPDIAVPQLSDPDYKARPRFREADLSRHLINEAKVDNSVLEADEKPDPRFKATPEELKAKGITDFQLHYAIETVSRLGRPKLAAAAPRKAVRR